MDKLRPVSVVVKTATICYPGLPPMECLLGGYVVFELAAHRGEARQDEPVRYEDDPSKTKDDPPEPASDDNRAAVESGGAADRHNDRIQPPDFDSETLDDEHLGEDYVDDEANDEGGEDQAGEDCDPAEPDNADTSRTSLPDGVEAHVQFQAASDGECAERQSNGTETTSLGASSEASQSACYPTYVLASTSSSGRRTNRRRPAVQERLSFERQTLLRQKLRALGYGEDDIVILLVDRFRKVALDRLSWIQSYQLEQAIDKSEIAAICGEVRN